MVIVMSSTLALAVAYLRYMKVLAVSSCTWGYAQAILDDFVGRVEDMGMSIQRRQVEPCLETRTVLGNDRDYEGGFVLLTVSAASHNA